MTKEHVLIVDGAQLLWRSVQKNAAMKAANGEPNGCFVGSVDRLITDLIYLKHDSLCVVWDVGEPRWPRTLWPAYKTKAHPDPEAEKSLYRQMHYVQQFFRLAGIRQLGALGVEADSIISLVATALVDKGHLVTVLAQDKDLHQICGPGIRIYEPVQRRWVEEMWVFEKYGLRPWQLPDLFALSGEGGDDIPKVPLVGPKKARDLLEKFGSLRVLMEAAREDLPGGKTGDAIFEGETTLRIARELVTLPVVRDGEILTEFRLRFTAEEWNAIAIRLWRNIPRQEKAFRRMEDDWGASHLATSVLLRERSPSFEGLESFWRNDNGLRNG